MKRCKRKSDLKEYRYFIFGVDDSSEIIDIGCYDLPVGFMVLVDKDVPVVRCWMPVEEFDENYVPVQNVEEIDMNSSNPVPDGVIDLSGNIGKCTSKVFVDDTVFEYFIYDRNSKWYPEWFPNVIKDYYLERYS